MRRPWTSSGNQVHSWPQHATSPPARNPHVAHAPASRATNAPSGGRCVAVPSFQHTASPLPARTAQIRGHKREISSVWNGPEGHSPP